ncbi:MAG: acyl carrier protein [Deltaproteobacteria bacterium]|nr:acyl carrier protein [Deltaproteobacteria bacterium]MBI3388985.1 acyl carrier protein [Deltaproteobacteria bacterium]
MTGSEIRAQLRTFICNELIRDPAFVINDDEPLITGGLIDSFSLAYVGVFIEEAFGVYIPDTDLTVESMDTLDQMVTRVLQG